MSGGTTNTGTISASGGRSAFGIVLENRSTLSGGITNTGTISASGGNFGEGIFLVASTLSGGSQHRHDQRQRGNFGEGIFLTASTLSGGTTNTGTISASGGRSAFGIVLENTAPFRRGH